MAGVGVIVDLSRGSKELLSRLKKGEPIRRAKMEIAKRVEKEVLRAERSMIKHMTDPSGPTPKTLGADPSSPIVDTIGHLPRNIAKGWTGSTLRISVGAIKGSRHWQMIANVHDQGTTIYPRKAAKLAIPYGPIKDKKLRHGSRRRRKSVRDVLAERKYSFIKFSSGSISARLRGTSGRLEMLYYRAEKANLPRREIITGRMEMLNNGITKIVNYKMFDNIFKKGNL